MPAVLGAAGGAASLGLRVRASATHARVCMPHSPSTPAYPSALVHSPFTHTWQVSEAWRDGYGEAYGEGDVIGCLIHLPPGGGMWEKTLEGEKLGLRIVSYEWVVVAVVRV